MRYTQITDLLQELKPDTILEVGTWAGIRAREMMTASGASFYYGFDLFEDGTPEDDEAEFNVKPHYSLADVLDTFDFPARLVKGYSTDTLPRFLEEMGPEGIDFAFIDGGHSVATIESDWRYVSQLIKPGGVILLDDYYSGMPESFLDQFGCNRLADALQAEILPDADPVKGGGWVQIAKAVISGDYNQPD